jgi:hypothetical protein
VQTKGYITVDATVGGFAVGWNTVIANATGGIKYASAATGKPMYKIVNINTSDDEITLDLG